MDTDFDGPKRWMTRAKGKPIVEDDPELRTNHEHVQHPLLPSAQRNRLLSVQRARSVIRSLHFPKRCQCLCLNSKELEIDRRFHAHPCPIRNRRLAVVPPIERSTSRELEVVTPLIVDPSRGITVDQLRVYDRRVVLGPSGNRLRHERFQTSAELLRGFIKEVPRPRHLCLEEGTLSEWLCEQLTPVVDKLVVVMPDRSSGNKSDLIDACKLADDLRRDAIRRPVYKAPGHFRALREAARTHYVLQRDKVRTKSRLSALCRGCGRAELGKSLDASKTRAEALQQLPEHLRPRAALFGKQLDALLECSNQAEQNLREQCGHVPVVQRLSTAPGIGIVRAAYIVAIVMTPHRFRTTRQFWSYSGSVTEFPSSLRNLSKANGVSRFAEISRSNSWGSLRNQS